MTDRLIAEVRDYQELVAALRARVVELGVASETIDEVAGIPLRYTAKLLAPIPVKGLGRFSMGPLLGALALKLLVVEDTEMVEKLRHRWVPTRNASRSMLATKSPARSRFPRGPAFATLMQARRVLKQSPEQRSRIATKAARARWSKRRRPASRV